MCGLLFVLGLVSPGETVSGISNDGSHSKFFSDLTGLDVEEMNVWISKRGPDVSSYGSTIYTSRSPLPDSPKVALGFWGHTLFLRGTHPTPQPLIHNTTGDTLCWNGEVFGGFDVHLDANDGQVILESLASFQTHEEIISFMLELKGPHGFVFYKASLSKVYFGRDKIGIRSLLQASSNSGWLSLASVGPPTNCDDWKEVDTQTLFYLDLESLISAYKNKAGQFSMEALIQPATLIAPVHLTISTHITEDSAILPECNEAREIFNFHLAQENYSEAIQGFERVMSESVRLRVISIPPPTSSKSARLAVLFSGGIDCTMLAFFAHRFIPLDEPIDLLNVSFENPRISAASMSKGQAPPPAPDRITGQTSLEELRTLCPGRTFRFIRVDVTFAEVEECRERLLVLLYPNVTEMDLSIAMAFWFAARGKGVDGIPVQTEAKVLLSGLGADEQLGGYSRHRSAFERGGVPELIKEVQLDVSRISKRNLGRDDRVISDRGKETRYPFLDLDVINFLNTLPIQTKSEMRYPRGIGEKFLLRLLASKVGFSAPAMFPKRAVQFGARSAKMRAGDSKLKGHHQLKSTEA